MNPHALLGPLLAVAGVVALGVIAAYTLFAPWWSTRAGRAVFALYWTFGLIILHFASEAAFGQASDWVEVALLLLVIAVISWNGYTIVSKQLRARRNHEEGH